ATAGNTCLVWQPRLSTTGSPLNRSVSGRIVYREPVQSPTRADHRALQQRERQLQIIQQQQLLREIRVRRAGRPQTVAPQNRTIPKSDGMGTLYLLAGDRIPCESIEIDDRGVHFKSSVVDAAFVPHNVVKALELVPNWTDAALADEKRQRLLTLPRIQKNNPPTHLVASTGGDILRTSLVSLSDDTLTVESRLESKRIPRDRVACVIWLHDESGRAEADSRTLPPHTEDTGDLTLVQAVRVDGVRLTFAPQECTGPSLIGASQLLGVCRLELKKVDVLLLGSMIQAMADEQAFHDWKLTGAAEPRYVSDEAQGAGGEPSSGGSGLIGKHALDFSLELLDGDEFKLSEQKGHVVVLDFWASWCGPCMQWLPQVDTIAAEFAERGVKLVAVNMQEDRAAATSALERLKIKPTVALDIDGAVAEHYQVTAIPHTIVIDAEGNIAQLFIGSSAESAVQLRTAIEDLLTPRTTH
ncbi:MAG TPA: TlpA disulfide reductase family protein, partial [Lacipirellulaceae bacterium]